MGNDISRERIIELAREQELRRQGIKKENRTSGGGVGEASVKKAKVVERKRTKSKPVQAFRPVLYTFRADAAYPEQVTILQDQVIWVVEDCGDGWSTIVLNKSDSSSHNGKEKRGVVPTSYLGKNIQQHSTGATTSSSSGMSSGGGEGKSSSEDGFVKREIKRRLVVVKNSFVLKMTQIGLAFVDFGVYSAGAIVTKIAKPAAINIYNMIATRSVNFSFVFGAISSFREWVITLAIPHLSEKKLGELVVELKMESQLIRSELLQRLKDLEFKKQESAVTSKHHHHHHEQKEQQQQQGEAEDVDADAEEKKTQ